MKATRAGIKGKVVPTTEEQAWDVVTNKTQSAATKECIGCLKDSSKKAVECAKLCGFSAQ